MKKLEEMNLMDDFLVYSLMSHKIYGEEAARYILECILQRRIGRLKVVAQRGWPGEGQENHGVRMGEYTFRRTGKAASDGGRGESG